MLPSITCPKCGSPNRSGARFCTSCGATLSEPSTSQGGRGTAVSKLQSGSVLHNRYRVENELGRGGFGAVYRGWDANLNRPCAIKENLETSAEAQRQFMREAMVLGNLSHPNLPRVIDYFIVEEQGQYLVMDYVEGDDLANLLNRSGIIPVHQTVEWAKQVADALVYLHNRPTPVFHRDIKPSNIRITPDGQAMLVDFGLVKVFDQQLKTTIGARAVTPGYAPPEQYGQGRTDARSDIYALGATLYTALTEKLPLESVQRMSGGQLQAADQINPTVPVALSKVIDRAMRLNPIERFQTAAEFKNALSESLGGGRGTRGEAMVNPLPQAKHVPATIVAPVPDVRTPSPARPKKRSSGSGRAVLGVGIVLALVLCIGSIAGLGAWAIGLQGNAAKEKTAIAEQATQTADQYQSATETNNALLTEMVENRATSTANSFATASARVQMTATALALETLSSMDAIQQTQIAPATGYIASLDSDVTSMLFYLSKDGEKNYGTQFLKSEADRVYFELNLKHNTPSYRTFTLTVIYYFPDGKIHQFTSDHTREADWTTSWHTNSWGWDTPGNYPLGTYQVDIFVEGVKVATGNFEIVDSLKQ